jgi:glycosyltransferase involved in cell wall biosynthesis
MKKVGIVTTPLTSGHAVRGIGFYTQRLITGLKQIAHEYDIEIIEGVENVDLVHYPFFDLFSRSLPIFDSQKTVATVHDVVPLEFPDHYPVGILGNFNLQLQKIALKRVDRVITDSYYSVKSIHKYLDVPHDKIRMVYLAADPIFKPVKQKTLLNKIKSKLQLPDKFILYVGDIGWNKNIPTLVKAAEEINMPLVIAGKHALGIEKLDLDHPELQHLKDLPLDNVLRVGFVSEEDLVGLYNLATVYCQPSFAEGFGLPVLEALACDCPVVSSNAHSLPEVGGDAVEYFDPHDLKDLIRALGQVKSRHGSTQANLFSWEKTALNTIMVYQELLERQ